MPAIDPAWLHVVSGAQPERIAQGVLELVLRPGPPGRTLIVDAGRRLDLHERLGADQRWGLEECLRGQLPLLGVVQQVAAPGIFFLARGTGGAGEDWMRVGRLIDDARPHFSRIILALDPTAPRAASDSIQGREAGAWWVGGGAVGPAALALGERLGITLWPLELSGTLEDLLEKLPPATAAAAEPGATDMGAEEPAAIAPAEEISAPRPAARILDSEPRVRERLRFLVWMRTLRRPGRRPAPAPRLVVPSS